MARPKFRLLGDRLYDAHGDILRRHPRPGQPGLPPPPAAGEIDARLGALTSVVSQLTKSVDLLAQARSGRTAPPGPGPV